MIRPLSALIASGLALVGLAGAAHAQTASLVYVEDELGLGIDTLGPTGISDNGTVVSANGFDAGPGVFYPLKWTKAGGLELLQTPAGGVNPVTYGISGDGKYIWGSYIVPGGTAAACRWNPDGTITVFNGFGGNPTGDRAAFCTTADGLKGYGAANNTNNVKRGALFNVGANATNLGTLAGFEESDIRACSSDGSVLVGALVDFESPNLIQPGRRLGSTWQSLGVITDMIEGSAESVSGDGSIVVVSAIFDGAGAFERGLLWTQASGLTTLPTLTPTALDFLAFNIARGGSRIAGYEQVAQGILGAKAVFWDAPFTAAQDLTARLQSSGVQVEFPLRQALEINADGTVLAGRGFDPVSLFQPMWIATLSDGPSCFADCDGSGGLTIDDFICFQTNYALGDPAADCDASGQLNIDDFICFQTGFALGC
jgi:uncharacterized membrane protein